jgi:Glycosyl hydrolases family 38 N-terminal domain
LFDTSLEFIKENFGQLPKVGMSIDGFGHSSLTPYLFRALGHEAMVVFRMPYELYGGFEREHEYFFTWEGDNEERIRVMRLVVYSLDERFNLDRSQYNYGTCFRNEDTCAEQFLQIHLNNQVFNVEDTLPTY